MKENYATVTVLIHCLGACQEDFDRLNVFMFLKTSKFWSQVISDKKGLRVCWHL